MKTLNLDRLMERQNKALARQQAAAQKVIGRIEALDAQRQAYLEELAEITGGAISAGAARATRATSGASTRSAVSGTAHARVAPRGTLTAAVLGLFDPKKPAMKLHIEQIMVSLKDNAEIAKIPNWQRKIYNLVNTNKERFTRTGEQEFKVNKRPKDSALFQRLAEEGKAASGNKKRQKAAA